MTVPAPLTAAEVEKMIERARNEFACGQDADDFTALAADWRRLHELQVEFQSDGIACENELAAVRAQLDAVTRELVAQRENEHAVMTDLLQTRQQLADAVAALEWIAKDLSAGADWDETNWPKTIAWAVRIAKETLHRLRGKDGR